MKPVLKPPVVRNTNLHTPPAVQRAAPGMPLAGRKAPQPFRPQPVRVAAPAPFRPASANIAKPSSLQLARAPHAQKRAFVGKLQCGGKKVSVYGVGPRYGEHISPKKAFAYFLRYTDEIVAGDRKTLLVGDGRESGYAVFGNIKYAFNGNEIIYWHAHERGRMG